MTSRSLYLMTVDWSQRAGATAAVYRARKALGGEPRSQNDAFSIVERCYNGGDSYVPALIGYATSEGTLTLARKILDDAALTYAVDPTPEEVFGNTIEPPTISGRTQAEVNERKLRAVPDVEGKGTDEENAGDNIFTPEEYETAMLLIVGMRGNPFAALSLAGGLAKTTRSDSYKRVQEAILKVFPAESPQAMSLVAQVLEDDPDA